MAPSFPFFVFVFGFVFVSVFLLCLYLYLYYDDLCMGMRRWWWRMVRPSCRHRLRLWPVADVAATGRRTPGKATPPASAPATKLPETEIEVRQENGRIAAEARNKKSIGGQPNRVIQVRCLPSSLKISPLRFISFQNQSMDASVKYANTNPIRSQKVSKS